MSVHKTIALLSKRFQKLCRGHIPAILGHLDADLILNSWHRYTPWLTKNALRLKSLKLKSKVFEDSAILLYIFHKCNVADLETLTACFQMFGPKHNSTMWTMVEFAHGSPRDDLEDGEEAVASYLPVT